MMHHKALSIAFITIALVLLPISCSLTSIDSPQSSFIGLPDGLELEVFFQKSGLDPVKLAFTPDGRLFYTKMGLDGVGEIRIIQDRLLLSKPFASFDVATCDWCGMTGLTIDPKYDVNGYIYASYIVPSRQDASLPAGLRVVRFTDVGNTGVNLTTIIDLPVLDECCQRGGDLAFSTDEKLYISVADADSGILASNPDHPAGKILRLNKDGSAPTDNPFYDPQAPPNAPGNYVFAYGFRYVNSLASSSISPGRLYAAEQGESTLDEVNLIQSSGNYGWPDWEGWNPSGHVGDHIDPVLTVGPPLPFLTGVLFYEGDALPDFTHKLLVCEFNTGIVRLFTMESPDYNKAVQEELLFDNVCRLDVAVSPDGLIYLSDWSIIYRIIPSSSE